MSPKTQYKVFFWRNVCNDHKIDSDTSPIYFSLLITKALKETKSNDYDTCVEYCIQNEFIEDDAKNDSFEVLDFDQVKSNFKTNRDHSLEKIYEKLWNDFVKYLDTNFDDFVSLNHLGLVLDYLQSKRNLEVSRVYPSYLESGNLL